MNPFTVIPGGKRNRPYACTWCGSRFEQRDQLDGHWAGNSQCRKNRAVSNATQTKYSDNLGKTPVCACHHDGTVHTRAGGGCLACLCRVFSLAGFRD